VAIIFTLLFLVLGAELEFLNCTIFYNIYFGSIVGIRQGLENFAHGLFWSPHENYVLWILGFCGAVTAFFNRDRKGLFLIMWLLGSLLALCSALRFYHQYFIGIIPALVVMMVYFIQEVWCSPGTPKKVIAVLLSILTIVFYCSTQWMWWFVYKPAESLIYRRGVLARPELYGQAAEASDFIIKRTDSADLIHVWGLWPEIYHLTGRRSPSKYFYISSRGTMVGRFKEAVQTQVYYDIIRNPPKFIVIDDHFADLIAEPMQRYINSGYALAKQGRGYRILSRRDTVF
jgi:hypothetical protein